MCKAYSTYYFLSVIERKEQQGFSGIENEISKIKDRWFQFFGSLILGHGIYRVQDFGNVIDILIKL